MEFSLDFSVGQSSQSHLATVKQNRRQDLLQGSVHTTLVFLNDISLFYIPLQSLLKQRNELERRVERPEQAAFLDAYVEELL